MTKKIKKILAVSIAVVIFFIASLVIGKKFQKIKNQPIQAPQIVGGNCEYTKIKGSCKIISADTDNVVKFLYSPKNDLSQSEKSLVKNISGERVDTLNNLNPERVSVMAGETINCEVSIEIDGTCTPIIFRFLN